jgi:hypothetical protein
MILCSVNWYQAPSSLKLMIDRLARADGSRFQDEKCVIVARKIQDNVDLSVRRTELTQLNYFMDVSTYRNSSGCERKKPLSIYSRTWREAEAVALQDLFGQEKPTR